MAKSDFQFFPGYQGALMFHVNFSLQDFSIFQNFSFLSLYFVLIHVIEFEVTTWETKGHTEILRHSSKLVINNL